MSDDLPQAEADYLFGLQKRPAKTGVVTWPHEGKKVEVELVAVEERENFLLDISRSSIKLTKLTLQNRARVTVILARLDIDGPPHRNPDDAEVPCPHLHLYREGYGDKWAIYPPGEHFSDLTDRRRTAADFMRFCRIVEPPLFDEDLLA